MPSFPARSRTVLVAGAVFLIAMAYLWGRDRTLAAARRVETSRQAMEVLQRRVDRLELEVTAGLASDRIVEQARARLGLDFPDAPIPVIAVRPARGEGGPDVWTYVENALVMAVEGLERHLSPAAEASEVPARPDTSGGG
jgi:hypothetical protein